MARGQRSETKLRRSTGTHKLEGFHGRRPGIRDRTEEKHRNSHAEWNFMAGGQRSETELRRLTC